ncbi:MAG: hypothetical protein AAB604_00005 [Patescibacteria group bacterium]
MLGEFLFWFHVSVIAGAVASGFFLPLPFVLLAIVAHRAHLWVFGDCLLTKMKRACWAIRQEEDFLIYAARRFFDTRITPRGSKFINYLIYASTILLALAGNYR